jgi:AAA+ ATPase superfamily predicted ATPase
LTAGSDAEDFSISFTLSGIPETEHFVGRKKELNKIRQLLRGDGSHREIIVLWGLGGMGKTQLAVRFTKQLRDTYSAIFWLNAKNEEMVKQSFVKMAKRLYHNYPLSTLWKTAAEAKDVNKIVEAIKRWLSAKNNTRWLLVFDSFDNPQAYDIRSYFPEAHQGFILITTRSSRLRIGKVIPIEKFREIKESIMILAHMSGRKISDRGRH